MTPREARFGLIAFALLLAGLSVNLFALQGSTPASPSKARSERGQPIVTHNAARTPPAVPDETAGLAPTPADAAPAPGVEAVNIVRAIQRELHIRNYETGAADGTLNLLTQAAIMAYEHDHGLPLSGEASEDTLRRILLGVASAKSASNGQANRLGRRANTAEMVIRTVQQSLSGLGYNTGPINGKLTEETRRAIRDFEIDSRLPETGRVSGTLIGRLSKVAGNSRKPGPR